MRWRSSRSAIFVLEIVCSYLDEFLDVMQAVFVCTSPLMNEVRSSSRAQALRHWPMLTSFHKRSWLCQTRFPASSHLLNVIPDRGICYARKRLIKDA
jgi:hypothetical protein